MHHFGTVNGFQVPVVGFFAMDQGKGEGLRKGSAVSVVSLDEHRLGFLQAHEGLRLRQFGGVVIHIQQPHRHHALVELFRVIC